MWWSSFRSILEILIKASYSEALLERLKFPTGSTMMKSSQDRQQPWRYFYSRDLFVHQVWLVSVIRDQIRNSLYFWFSLFCQLIEFLISLRKLLASFQEDTSEQKKRKNSPTGRGCPGITGGKVPHEGIIFAPVGSYHRGGNAIEMPS